MNCRDFREFIDSFLSDELLTETNHEILRHLEECVDCRGDIKARRAVRTRLRSAVRTSSDFQIAAGFERSLRAELRRARPEKKTFASIFGLNRYVVGGAAGLLIVLSLGLFYVLQFGGAAGGPGGGDVLLASALPASHIVNVAAQDHEKCAVDHFSKKPAVEVNDVSEEYRGLAKAVSAGLTPVLKDCKLVDSHACGYGKTRFSHVVMKDKGKMVSVLVANGEADEQSVRRGISRFASDKYSISRFNIASRSVFVISQLDNERNSRAAEALTAPLEILFDPLRDTGSQPALLFAH